MLHWVRRLAVPALLSLACGSPVLAQAPYAGPVIDGHNHWNGSRDAEKFLDLMRANNVVATVIMPRAYGSKTNSSDLPTTDEETLRAVGVNASQLFPTVGMQLPQLTDADWDAPSAALKSLYRSVETKVQSGQFYGIGEVIIRHYPYFNHPSVASTGKHMQIDKSPDSVHFRRLAAIANQHRMPINIHMEGEPRLVAGLQQVLKEFPDARFIWAHMCGRIAPEQIARLLEQHPNLWCDLAAMVNVGPTGYGYSQGKNFPARAGWPEAHAWTHLMEDNGRFYPQVHQLLLAFPSRFIGVGMDNAHGAMPVKVYTNRLQRFRTLLGTLPTDVARQLACTNAKEVWKLPVAC